MKIAQHSRLVGDEEFTFISHYKKRGQDRFIYRSERAKAILTSLPCSNPENLNVRGFYATILVNLSFILNAFFRR